jgi:hypothetical protein
VLKISFTRPDRIRLALLCPSCASLPRAKAKRLLGKTIRDQFFGGEAVEIRSVPALPPGERA